MRTYLCIQCNIVCGNYKFGKTSKNLFCSSQCQHDYDWLKRKQYIKDTGIGGSSRVTRKYMIEEYGHMCVICKSTTWCWKPIPLVLDHIDGDSDNWELINLRMLCCNCDAQTSTYKGKNRGNGRHSRRERYKAGKSY